MMYYVFQVILIKSSFAYFRFVIKLNYVVRGDKNVSSCV